MDVEVKIDPRYGEPKLVIHTAEITDEVKAVLDKLGSEAAEQLAGFQNDMVTIIETAGIIRLYGEQQKVFAETESGTFLIKYRLYEVENILKNQRFVRISNSEIINLRKVKNMDLSLSGTICVKLLNGRISYVSRRYVAKIKTLLGL